MGIVRGTQLLGHGFRMARQSAKDWGRAVTAMTIVFTALNLYMRIDGVHLSHLSAAFQAIYYDSTGRSEYQLPLASRAATTAAKEKYILIMNYLKKDQDPNIVNQVIYNHYRAGYIRKANLTSKEIGNSISIFWQSIIVSFIISIALTVLIFTIIANKDKKTEGHTFVRGRKITTATKLNQLINKANKKEYITNSYSVAGINFPPYGETEHLMITGTTGTGKTVLLKNLIKQIKERGDKAIIYDYTGAFVEGYFDPEKDILVNPFDKRSKSWCLLKEAENEAEFETIAEALIGGSDAINDPFWPNGARLIFSELCKVQFRRGNFNTQELYNHLLLPVVKLNKVLKNTLAQNFTNPSSEKTTLSLLMLMTTYLKGLQHVNNDGNNDFSIKKWLLDPNEKNILFLSSRSTLHNSIQPLISAMMDIAINNLGELPIRNKQKTWIIFDEVASLNHLPSLEKGLTVSRNFGGCFVIALQSISQLIKRYGAQDAETITSNCSSKIILKAGNNETTKWASQFLGTQEIDEYREGLSYGAHEVRDGVNLTKNRSERPLALASEIAALPRFNGYAAMTGGFPIAQVNFEHLKTEKCLFSNSAYIPVSVSVKKITDIIDEDENDYI